MSPLNEEYYDMFVCSFLEENLRLQCQGRNNDTDIFHAQTTLEKES